MTSERLESEGVAFRNVVTGQARPDEDLKKEAAAAADDAQYILCEDLFKIYKQDELEVVALRGLDLKVRRGEMMAIVGASGSGKTTLLNILAGLDVPSAGRAVVAGHDLGRMKGNERTLYRRRVVGMIWQETARNLLPYLSAVENVEMPMSLDGKNNARKRA